MSRTDERIRAEIRQLADPPDPAGVFDRVERLLARRAIARRVQAVGLAVLVVTGTTLGVIGLARLFGGGQTVPSTPDVPVAEVIVFHQDIEGNLDLVAVHPDGSGRQRLTHDRAADVYPAISPDGARIAFVSDRTGHSQIYVMPAGGGPATALTEGPAESYDPTWSPDGTRIAFGSNRTGNGDVYVMDADGTNVVQVTGLGLRPPPPDIIGADDTRQFEGYPTWSPDGMRIAFVGEVGDNAEIFVMDADGSNVVQVTDHPIGDIGPEWSPDGDWIAFHTSRGQPAHDIYVVRPDGTDLTRLTDDPGRDIQPAWSPDGTQIVFASDRDGALRLFVMDADGSNVVPLTEGDAAGPTWGRLAEEPPPEETAPPDGSPTGWRAEVEAQEGPMDAFVPPTRTEGDLEVMPVTFPDGTTAEVAYPRELDLAGDLRPYSSGSIPGVARDFWIFYGRVEEVLARLGGAELLGEHPDGQGGSVGFWDLRADREAHYLAFQFESWSLLVYDYGAEGVGPSMTDAERELWARSLGGRETETGSLVLEALSPLELANAGDHAGPELELGALNPRRMMLLFPGPCEQYRAGEGGFEEDELVEVDGIVMDRSPDFASWCDPGGLMRVHVYQAPGDDYIDRVALGLEIREVHLAQAGN